MKNKNIRQNCFHVLSLLTIIFILISIFIIHIGLVRNDYIILAVLTLLSAVALRYVAIYHNFSKPIYRTVAFFVFFVAFGISGAGSVEVVLSSVSLEEFQNALGTDTFHFGIAAFPSDIWIAIPLALAGSLMVIGSTKMHGSSPYPKPTNIREIASSPVYFGTVCIFFGLWAVLFAGVSIQRVLIIAPVFEEGLKFGVALLVGSVLFGRSLLARVGAAIVVGLLFGIIEHTTTYPMEADAVYTFRVVFHAMTTVLSVTTYTLFGLQGERTLQWISPAYSIIIHFFNNIFSVLSTSIGIFVLGSGNATVALIYGSAAILLMVVVLMISFISRKALVAIHMPLEHVLSDLV